VNRQRVTAPQLAPFVAKLGIQWDLTYWHVPSTEPGGDIPARISCDPIKKSHEVWVNDGGMRAPGFFLPDLVHELCHASLAERVDPVFASIRFGPESRRMDCEQPEEFVRRANELWLATRHEDVWVNDLRHFHWPELSQQDADSFSQSALALAQAGRWDIMGQPVMLLGLALQLAETARRRLRSADLSPVLRGLGREQRRIVSRASRWMKNLPRLSNERELALKTYERAALEAVGLYGLSLRPRLIEDPERGQAVWEVV